MVVVTAPSLSRAGSLNCRMHKRASRALSPEGPPTPTSAFVPPTSSLDVRMSLILTPSPTLVPPPLPSTTSTESPTTPSTAAAGPKSSWMDTMGKKLSGLQKAPTYVFPLVCRALPTLIADR